MNELKDPAKITGSLAHKMNYVVLKTYSQNCIDPVLWKTPS